MIQFINCSDEGWTINGKVLLPLWAFPTEQSWFNHYETFFPCTLKRILDIFDENDRYGRQRILQEIVPILILRLNKKLTSHLY